MTSSFWKVFASFLVVLLLGLIVLSIIVYEQTSLAMERATAERLTLTTRLVETLLKDASPAEIESRFESFSAHLAPTVTLYDIQGGRLAGKSTPLLFSEEGFRNVDDTLTGVRRIQLKNGPAWIQASMEIRHPEELRVALAISFIIAALVAAAAGITIVRRFTAPIEEFTDVAEAMSRGDFDRRFPTEPGDIRALGAALNSVQENLRARLTELSQEQKVLRALLSGIHDAVLACDRQGRLVFANEPTSKFFRSDLSNAVGRPLAEVIRSEPLLRLVQQTLDGGMSAEAQMETPLGDRTLRAIATPVANPSDEAPRVIVVLYDITDAHRYENLRRQFVANVSHELRTPVSIIKGYLETLEDGAIQDKDKGVQFLSRIRRNVDQLANLVDDLLQLARMESQSGVAKIQSVDAAELVERVVANFEPMYSKKKHRVTVESDRPIDISADPELLERAVGNLLDNAIKYTPEGGTIEVSARREDEGCRIQVRDSGIGIPQADLARIFERFYRVDKSRSREMGGTGLGLAIVKHIAQIHSGRVDVQSQGGQGSTFTLWVPVRQG